MRDEFIVYVLAGMIEYYVEKTIWPSPEGPEVKIKESLSSYVRICGFGSTDELTAYKNFLYQSLPQSEKWNISLHSYNGVSSIPYLRAKRKGWVKLHGEASTVYRPCLEKSGLLPKIPYYAGQPSLDKIANDIARIEKEIERMSR